MDLILPAEILVEIMRYMGRRELQKSLTVSKQWMQYAEPVLLESVTLHLGQDLAKALKYEDTSRRYRMGQGMFEMTVLVPMATSTTHHWHYVTNRCTRERFLWISQELLLITKKLTTFRLEAIHDPGHQRDVPWMPGQTNELTPLFDTLINMSNLSKVHLNITWASSHARGYSRWEEPPHDCARIAQLMARVDDLELCVPKICLGIFAAFNSEGDGCQMVAKGPVRLVINRIQACAGCKHDICPYKYIAQQCFRTRCGRRCYQRRMVPPAPRGPKNRGRSIPLPMSTMIEHARDCIPRMSRLESMRILDYVWPVEHTVAYEVTTDKKYKVSDQDWTSEGELIENPDDPEWQWVQFSRFS